MLGSRFKGHVDDVTQQALINVLKQYRQASNGARLRNPQAVAHTIATRTAIDFFRRQEVESQRSTAELQVDQVADDRIPPDQILEERECVMLLVRQSFSVTEQVILRRTMDGWNVAEIASELGKSEGHVRRRKKKILGRLQEAVRSLT